MAAARHPSVRDMAAMPIELVDRLLQRHVVEHAGKEYSLDVTRIAKKYAASHGFSGNFGGWIWADTSRTGKPICQGWFSFYKLYAFKINSDLRDQIEAIRKKRK